MARTNLFVIAACVMLSATVFAGGWPQWAGPHRDFTAADVDLADRWPEKGPPKLWSRELGVGYAGIVVADGQLYTMYRKSRTDAVEHTIALDAANGKTIREFEHPAPLAGPPAEPSDERAGLIGGARCWYTCRAHWRPSNGKGVRVPCRPATVSGDGRRESCHWGRGPGKARRTG